MVPEMKKIILVPFSEPETCCIVPAKTLMGLELLAHHLIHFVILDWILTHMHRTTTSIIMYDSYDIHL